jgi:hypothetical protein
MHYFTCINIVTNALYNSRKNFFQYLFKCISCLVLTHFVSNRNFSTIPVRCLQYWWSGCAEWLCLIWILYWTICFRFFPWLTTKWRLALTAKNVAENSVFTILYVLLIQVYIWAGWQDATKANNPLKWTKC